MAKASEIPDWVKRESKTLDAIYSPVHPGHTLNPYITKEHKLPPPWWAEYMTDETKK